MKKENDNIPHISKMQIDLMVNSFAADFARVATLQFTNSVGGARMHWLGVDGRPPRAVPPARQRREGVRTSSSRINKWWCEQMAYLAKRLAETPEPGGGGSLLDNTTDHVDQRTGQGQLAHAGQHPVRPGRQRPGFQDGSIAQVSEAAAQPAAAWRWLTAWATASRDSATRITAARGRCRT